ncbi:MAG TPA: amidase family protein [Mycobacteriales bacterium]|nr:amidase family protein [Mycobacteriales bacterium]
MTTAAAPIDEDAIAYAGVVGQAGMLRDGRIDSVGLVDLLLRRIDRLDLRTHAFRVVLADQVRQAAVEADTARREGDTRPLLGVPIAIKDNVALAGQPSFLGSGSPEPVATADDELVRRLRAAGLIVLGKTHLPELALWAATESRCFGITRNPWAPDRSPGGSSGGSAAAVAAGMVPAAHATDGLGSIRIPASACGLVGLKPSHGLVPLGPDPDHWNGMSHAGFLTRSVRDTAVLLDIATAGATRLAEGLDEPPTGLRIAVTSHAATPIRPGPAVKAALDAAVGILRGLGLTVIERDPPYGRTLPQSVSARYLAGVAHDVSQLADPGATEPRTRSLAAIGRRLPETSVPWARGQGADFGSRMAGFFDSVDLLLTPTMPVLPRWAGSLAGRGLARTLTLMTPCAAYTSPWNACGFPALNLPVFTTPSGIPVGVQLVGPLGSEALLLQVAAAVEPVAGWLDRRVEGRPAVRSLP